MTDLLADYMVEQYDKLTKENEKLKRALHELQRRYYGRTSPGDKRSNGEIFEAVIGPLDISPKI